MKPVASALLSTLVVAFAAPANATSFNNDYGLDDPDQIIDFESVVLGHNEPVSNQFHDLGVDFTTAFANPDLLIYPNISGNRIGNFRSGIGQGGQLFTATFTKPLSEVAFAAVTLPGSSITVTAMLGVDAVETATFATSNASFTNYYGFRDIVFDKITILSNATNLAFELDNLQTVPVPEPHSWALMLAGLGVGGLLIRRRVG